MLLKRQKNLKDAKESSSRELANVEEKCRQAQTKTNSLTKTVKDLTEDVIINLES